MKYNHHAKILALLLTPLLLSPNQGAALGHFSYVETKASPGSFCIAEKKTAALIRVDAGDFPGVLRAAKDLEMDVARVMGSPPKILRGGKSVILVGTIGKSPLIDQLIREKKIEVSEITGQWESFLIQVVPKPLPDVEMALVIAGSDKRGTIYGIYDLSEQMGVSPWCWWADVPVQRQDALFVKAGKYVQGPPAVKYRGIFLNDEAPALSGWAKEKYGGLNHQVYTKVFELLLRLKANYLWPAMWDNAFNEDDPLNPKLADEYGIVMGTSHHEPMLRAQQEWKRHGTGPWNYSTNAEVLRAFWDQGIQRNKDYESVITLGMRGDGDLPMSQEANISLLEKIVADQRSLLAQRMNTNLSVVPQDWALYKEVQTYYDKGMRVPDDVTLLWCDDNWGNIRRLPTESERKRGGGAGVYYHFDYVGGPRNYKWLNTNPINKIWEQMNLAYQYGADRIWIVNVGDLKPMEFPIDFFLTFAWNLERWPKERLGEYTRLWAQRQFGPGCAPEIAELLAEYTKYNGWRKPELLEPNTFNLTNYEEADTVLAGWNSLAAQAEQVGKKLPRKAQDAFFQLVLHPIKASAQVNALYIVAAKNQLYARQGRASANELAAQARALFQADADLSAYYNHTLAKGKWNHMMDQTHLGYTYWQQPPSNSMPPVVEIKLPITGEMGLAIQGSASVWPGATNEAVLPQFDSFTQPRRYIDVFNRGQQPFSFQAIASEPWIVISSSQGKVEREQRLWLSVDWSKVKKASSSGWVKITGADRTSVQVEVNLFNPEQPSRSSLEGFVETDGYVAIEAEHYTKKVDASAARWEKIPDLGRTLSSMTIFPVTAPSVFPPQDSPCLEYQIYLFSHGKAEVEASIAPSLNFAPGRGVRFAISFDDELPKVVTAIPQDYVAGDGVRDWEKSVSDSIRSVKSAHSFDKSGCHTLKFWMVDPGVVLEKLVVDLGGVKPSYFGPPESFHREHVSNAARGEAH